MGDNVTRVIIYVIDDSPAKTGFIADELHKSGLFTECTIVRCYSVRSIIEDVENRTDLKNSTQTNHIFVGVVDLVDEEEIKKVDGSMGDFGFHNLAIDILNNGIKHLREKYKFRPIIFTNVINHGDWLINKFHEDSKFVKKKKAEEKNKEIKDLAGLTNIVNKKWVKPSSQGNVNEDNVGEVITKLKKLIEDARGDTI